MVVFGEPQRGESDGEWFVVGTGVVAEVTLSVEPHGAIGSRMAWRWTCTVVTPMVETEWTDNDLSEPACRTAGKSEDDNDRDMLRSLLSFLGAAIEGAEYRARTGRESDNEDLFPAEMIDALRGLGVTSSDLAIAEGAE